jgi:hypothetical protein
MTALARFWILEFRIQILQQKDQNRWKLSYMNL